MKILKTIDSFFNTKQIQLLEDYLNNKVLSGNIQWKETFDGLFNSYSDQLKDGFSFTKFDYQSKIKENYISEIFNNIFISLSSLSYELYNLSSTISRHEMFRKDTVKSTFNLANNYIDMVNNEVKDYKTNNIFIENGIVEMLPSTLIDFPIKTVDVAYFPENYIDRNGNDPTPENISPGTDKDYWLSEIITQRRVDVGAYITIGFNGFIKFNILQFNVASKYPVQIEKVYVKLNSEFIEKDFKIEYFGKQIQLTAMEGNISTIYSTEYIKFKIKQTKPDFVWEKTINNEKELLEYDTEYQNNIKDYIYNDDFYLYKEKTVRNCFSYMFGLYFLRVLLKTYDGDSISNFYSKKFFMDDKYHFIINSDESKDSPFTIEYRIIQQNGMYANVEGDLIPYNKIKLLDTFSENTTVSNVSNNIIKLDYYPLFNSDFLCRVNNKNVSLVKEFNTSDELQVIINKDVLYFNRNLNPSDIIQVYYKHYTSYIIVQATLKTNTVYNSSTCPKILKFNVEKI